MASTGQSHPALPSRPYASSLLSGSKPAERSTGLGFGASSHRHNAREAARLERERQELQRERERAAAQQQQQASGSAAGSMAQLTDEQKDEINEAVSPPIDILAKTQI